jgi:hypothetical protein
VNDAQIYNLLVASREQFTWKCDPHIIARAKWENPPQVWYLGSVLRYMKTGKADHKFIYLSDDQKGEIGLGKGGAERIHNAYNNYPKHDGALRALMLEALGLKEMG